MDNCLETNIRSYTLPARLLILTCVQGGKKKSLHAVTNYTLALIPSTSTFGAIVILTDKQLLFSAYISHQPDKKSDANLFSEATTPTLLHPLGPTPSSLSPRLSFLFRDEQRGVGVITAYLTLTDGHRAGRGVNGLFDSVKALSCANGAVSLLYFASGFRDT